MSEFEKAAKHVKGTGVLSELTAFLRDNKKWWVLPLIVVFVLFGVLAFLASTGAAPFIYTLF